MNINDDQINVLVVEDTPIWQTLIKTYLAQAGEKYNVHVSKTLASAGAHIKARESSEDPVDVILLDLTLPDSQGIDSFIKLNQVAREIPVVILTASDNDEARSKAMDSGAQGYLLKHRIPSSADGVGNPGYVLEVKIDDAIDLKRKEVQLREKQTELIKQKEYLETERDQWVQVMDKLWFFFVQFFGIARNIKIGGSAYDRAMAMLEAAADVGNRYASKEFQEVIKGEK